ncbi:ABC transporter permease [Polycladomyces subterraneus]|uniref:ABC transporter permease n=1 Tax=Polycladomyces subterraneus TaxID=1016997 RepID=A0ABT8INM2_9BACL|nr:ABC transporter permease subunit [Polycladomyces subterraneus]MDN4594398.1 ABC transporter permease [Polycladomyces subterraneus]
MKDLMVSEMERIWSRKKSLVSFVILGLLLVFMTFWLHRGGIGFYDPLHTTRLNSVNFPVFLLKEMSFILSLILIPMMVVDNFNGECTSGAYRLVMICPFSRWQLLTAKWVSQAIVIGAMLVMILLYGVVAGAVLFPHEQTVTFFHRPEAEGYGYVLLFYGWHSLIFLALLGIVGLLSSVLPNTIVAFFGSIAFLVGTVYASRQMFFSVDRGVGVQADGRHGDIFGFGIAGNLSDLLIQYDVRTVGEKGLGVLSLVCAIWLKSTDKKPCTPSCISGGGPVRLG